MHRLSGRVLVIAQEDKKKPVRLFIKYNQWKEYMNKSELIESVAAKSGLTKADSERAVKSFIETVTDTLKGGDQVTLIGFGTFLVRERKARQGRNPRTGETIQIKAANNPAFKAGKALKDAVN